MAKTAVRCVAEGKSCWEPWPSPLSSPFVRPDLPGAMSVGRADSPAQAGIHGHVTFRGAAAPNVELVLMSYRPAGSTETRVLTVSTASDGAYLFADVPNLASGMRYYVRYWNPAADDLFIAVWYGPDIPLYATGQSVAGGDFEVSDVILKSPAAGLKRALPIAFTWQKRATTNDTYVLRLTNADNSVRLNSEDVGYEDNYTLTELPEGLSFDQPLWWMIIPYNGPGSFGLSFYRRQITILSATATPRASPTREATATPTATITPTPLPPRPKIFMPSLLKEQ